VRLSLYFTRVYLGILLLMQLGLVIVVLATTLMDNAGIISRSEDSAAAALKMAFFGGVQFAYQVFPIACFLALLFCGTLLARSGELLAAQAAGISWMRVAAALLGVVSVVTLAGGVVGELVVPPFTARYDQLYYQQLGRGADSLTRFFVRQTEWFREGDLLLYLPSQERERESFNHVAAYHFADGLIDSVTDAERLGFEDGAWWLSGARTHDIATSVTTTSARLALPLRVSPRDMMDLTGDPRVMSSGDVAALIDRRQRAGFDAVAYRVELHNRAAFPLSTLGLFALGVAWALNPSRRRSLAVNLGAGVVAVGVFLSLAQIFRLLALGRLIPAPLGAWAIDLACVLCLPLSVVALRRARRRGSRFST
jgi:lipopolysaccharide export system permease protein